jgi:hypothetical protein
MGEQRQKFLMNRFCWLYATGALIVYSLLMAFVFPWWHADSGTVTLSLGMEHPGQVELGYGEGSVAELHPVGTLDGYHWDWRVELPVRPSYELALVFNEASEGNIRFKSIQLTPSGPQKEGGSLTSATLEDSPDDEVRLQPTLDGLAIYAGAGQRLALPVEIPKPGPYDWLRDWMKATVGFLLFALIILFSLTSFFRFPHGLQAYRKRPEPAEVALVLLAALLGGFAHLYLVRHSITVFTPAESEALVLQAVSMQQGTDSGLTTEELPGPGYPWLVAQIAPYRDWSLGIVSEAQALLFGCSILLLGLALVRVVQAYYVAPVMLLALLSPPAIWASRHIGTQSVMASATVLSLAVFLFLWQREGTLRWFGFALFGCIACAAVAVSTQGFLLLVFPIGMLVGTLWWSFSIRGLEFYKLPTLWQTLGQVAIPLILVLVPVLGAFPSTPGAGDDDAALREHAEVPLQARFATWGHVSGRGLFLPAMDQYSGHGSNTDYKLRFGFRNASDARAVRKELTQIMRITRQPVHVSEKKSNQHVVTYNETFVSIYSWFYRILFFAAIGGWLIALSERKYLAAILILPYLLNILAQVFLVGLVNYNVQSLDSCLWFSALAGLLAVNPKAMQKRTDETDRRCLAPIRPKRLLTRFKKVRKMPF